MATSDKIIDLRSLLANRFPQAPAIAAMRFVTGLPVLDQAIGGGLPQSAIIELICPGVSSGSASLIDVLLQLANQNHYFVALIDGRDSFDPSLLQHSSLCHLLWVRCNKAFEAIRAADLLLRDGNFPLVIVDLVLNPPEELLKIPQTSWYRLQRLVESAPTVCLVLTRNGMIASAQVKLLLENSWSFGNFGDQDALSQLQIRVQRSYRKSQVSY